MTTSWMRKINVWGGNSPLEWLQSWGATADNPTDAWKEVFVIYGLWDGTFTGSYIAWLQQQTGLSTRNRQKLESYALENNLFLFALINLSLLNSVGEAEFTRSSSGTYFDGSVSQEVGSDVARFEPQGYLNEKASTNLHPYSEDLSSHSQTRCTILTNQANDSFGNLTLDKIVENTDTNTHYNRYNFGTSLAPNTIHCYSFEVKADERTWAYITCKKNSGANIYLYYDIENDVFGSSGNIIEYGSKDLGGGIRRVWCTYLEGLSGGASFAGVGSATGNNGGNYTGDGSSGILVGNMKIEASPYPTSYVPNTGVGTTTRNADDLSETITEIPTDFSVITTVNIPFNGDLMSNDDFRIFGSDDSRGTSNEIAVVGGASYGYSAGIFTVDKSDFPANTDVNIGFSLAQEGGNIRAIIVVNGTEELNTTVAGTLDHSNNNKIQLGNWDGNSMTARFKDFKLFGVALSSQSLQTQTAA